MNEKKYISPDITDLGDAKEIIKNQFLVGTGDTFPGVDDALAS